MGKPLITFPEMAVMNPSVVNRLMENPIEGIGSSVVGSIDY